MPFFTWNPSYSVGVKEMDNQHQAMIDIINRLHEAMRTGKGSQEAGTIVTEMINYAKFHFAAEEKILADHSYPGHLSQKTKHNGFLKKALDFQDQYQKGKIGLSIEILNFLKDWWGGHILGDDQKYGPYLNQKGIS